MSEANVEPNPPADLADRLEARTIDHAEYVPNELNPESSYVVLTLDDGARVYADDPAYYGPHAKAPGDDD